MALIEFELGYSKSIFESKNLDHILLEGLMMGEKCAIRETRQDAHFGRSTLENWRA